MNSLVSPFVLLINHAAVATVYRFLEELFWKKLLVFSRELELNLILKLVLTIHDISGQIYLCTITFHGNWFKIFE